MQHQWRKKSRKTKHDCQKKLTLVAKIFSVLLLRRLILAIFSARPQDQSFCNGQEEVEYPSACVDAQREEVDNRKWKKKKKRRTKRKLMMMTVMMKEEKEVDDAST